MQTLYLYLPGIIVSFREGIEAFLIVIVLLRFLDKTDNSLLKKNIWTGILSGIIISIAVGGVLFGLGNIAGNANGIGKIWESLMSLIAAGCIISFVLWMIHNSKNIKQHIESEAGSHLYPWGIFLMTTVCIAREGVEVAIFSYAGEYPWQAIVWGIILAVGVILCLYVFSIRTKLTTLLNITLLYLIFQSGYLLGYSIHEGLSAFKELKILDTGNLLFIKAFDLSLTIFNHKEGIIGLPLNIVFGWYAKPEWVQFLAQYLCTGILLKIWMKSKTNQHR